MPKFVVESDIDVRTFDRPYHQRQVIGEFSCIADTYQFIEKYITDTKELYTYFCRHSLCAKDEFESLIGTDKPVAINIVLGHFEDALYVSRIN